VSIRKTLAILAVGASLFASGVPAHADEFEPDSATNQGYNDGENGAQSITANITNAVGDVLMKIQGDCEFTTVGKPNTNKTELVVAGHASSTVHSQKGAPAATGVRCEVFNASGGVDAKLALPGNSTAVAGTAEVTYGEFTMCITVTVTYTDTSFDSTKRTCRLPISPI